MVEIYDTDYNRSIDLIGTAHFTRRSINDAYEAVTTYRPSDICVELDWKRFAALNAACTHCPRNGSCKGLCEFTGASDALGNTDASIWLIDMSEQEIGQRIRSRMSPLDRGRAALQVYGSGNSVELWERGYKEKVVEDSKRNIEAMRRASPAVWGVLIDERNALMAARLAWIATKNIGAGKTSNVLAFVGAAHVEGISNLLRNPLRIKDELKRFNLRFTEPTLVRRIAVQGSSADVPLTP